MARQFIFCLVLILGRVVTGHASNAQMETIAVMGTSDMGDPFGPRFAEIGYRVIYGPRSPNSERIMNIVKRTGHVASTDT